MIQLAHDQHRLTVLHQARDQTRAESHFYSLLKKTHKIWKKDFAPFKPSQAQLKILKKLSDQNRDQKLAELEQQYNEPFVAKEKMKQKIREIIEKIEEKEKRKNTRDQCIYMLN